MIRRQAVIDACEQSINILEAVDRIMDLPSVKQEPSVEILKTEESNNNDTKYLNINVSDDEVKRNPDIVRLCSDVEILEYAKPQADVLDKIRAEIIQERESNTYGEYDKIFELCLLIIDKYRKKSEG